MTNTTHNVVKFSQDSAGKFVGVLTNSNPLLAQREPHGIKYEKDEKDGREYLTVYWTIVAAAAAAAAAAATMPMLVVVFAS